MPRPSNSTLPSAAPYAARHPRFRSRATDTSDISCAVDVPDASHTVDSSSALPLPIASMRAFAPAAAALRSYATPAAAPPSTDIPLVQGAHAYRIHRFGGTDTMLLEGVPLPVPAPGEAIVRVDAASVNPVDFKIRRGHYALVGDDQLPYVLGRDFAGVIESINGEGAGLSAGDRVFGMLSVDRGTYANRVLAKIGEMTHQPMRLSAIEAAAVPLAALTAWQGLFDQGRLQAGQTVLIHAAAGGVGHFAVQFAKAHGARVIATASGDGVDLVRSLGADRVIDYRRDRFEAVAGPVDLVYDLIGGETLQRSWELIREGGTLISALDDPSEEEAERRGVRALRYMAHPSVAQLDEIREWIDAGRLRVIVQQVFSFADAVAAHRLVEGGHVHGKVVLDLSGHH